MRRCTVRDHVRIEMHQYAPLLKRSSNVQWWAAQVTKVALQAQPQLL